jgi:hypothetical protein
MPNRPKPITFEAPQVREEYTSFHTEDGLLVVISDPQNARAWIRSTTAVEIEP